MVRLLNVAVGVVAGTLALATGAATAYAVAVALTGLAVAALSLPRGEIRETYGGWYRIIR